MYVKESYTHLEQKVVTISRGSSLRLVFDYGFSGINGIASWKLIFAGNDGHVKKKYIMGLTNAFETKYSLSNFASCGLSFQKYILSLCDNPETCDIRFLRNMNIGGLAINVDLISAIQCEHLVLPYNKNNTEFGLLPIESDEDVTLMARLIEDIVQLRQPNESRHWFGAHTIQLVDLKETQNTQHLHQKVFNACTKVH